MIYLLLGTLLIVAQVTTPIGPDPLQQLSEITFRSEAYEYEYRSSTLWKQNVWVVVGLRTRGQLGGPQQFQIWKLDSTGKKLAEIDFSAIVPTGDSQDKYVRIYDIAALKNGHIGLLAETGKGRIGFLVFNGDNAKLVTNRFLELPFSSTFISKILPADDGDLIAIGRLGFEGLLLKLQPSGEEAARVIIRDDLTVLNDALELTDDKFVLLGEHINNAGQTSIWVGKVTLKGEVLYKTTFAGRDGTITYDNGTRNYTITYVSTDTVPWNISLRTFTDELSLAGQFLVQTGLKESMRLNAISVGNGSIFVVGASPKNRLWTARVDRNGKIISSSIFEDPNAKWQRLWNYDLLATSAELVIPFTELLVGNEMEQRQVLKILRLRRQ